MLNAERLEERANPIAGELDSTFGVNGIVTSEFYLGGDNFVGAAAQPDGKIVAVGANYLARYLPNGAPDPSFGVGGIARFSVNFMTATAVAMQSDGQIVITGVASNGTNNVFATARFTAAGALDTGFGTGGRVMTQFDNNLNWAYSVAVQSDGKIVVAGYYRVVSNNQDDFAAARYNTDGTLDTTFSDDGKAVFSFGINTDQAYKVAVQPDGKILFAGRSQVASTLDMGVIRVLPDGTLDSTFSNDGMLSFDSQGTNEEGRGLALQSDGKIILTGFVNNSPQFQVGVVRLNADGSADNTFDGDGRVLTIFGSGGNRPFSAAVQADGKIVVATYSPNSGRNLCLLTRYLPNGALDPTFDGDGMLLTNLDLALESGNVILLPDGSMTVTGFRRQEGQMDSMLARFTTSGAVDTAYGQNGEVISPWGLSSDSIRNLMRTPTGDFYAFGGNIVAKYNAAGNLDPSFAGDGRIALAGFPGTGGASSSSWDGRGAARQSDGKIVVVGRLSETIITGGSTVNRSNDYAAWRLNADGSLDTTFDGDGTLNVSFNPIAPIFPTSSNAYLENPTAAAVQSDGKILLIGNAWNGSNLDMAVARVLPSGALDTSFSSDGLFVFPVGASADVANAVTVQPDGRIVLAGVAFNGSVSQIAVARLLADGSLDSSFDGDGRLITAIGSTNCEATSVVVQSDGKIVVGGYWLNGGGNDFALLRYHNDGVLDTTFDGDGIVITTVGANTDAIRTVGLTSDHRIVAAGEVHNGSNYDMVAARYLPNGVLDPEFSGDGIVITAVTASDEVANSLAVLPNDDVVIGGHANTAGGTNDFALLKIKGRNPTTLYVASHTPTTTGVRFTLSDPASLTSLNLFGNPGAADVRLMNGAGQTIGGSLTASADDMNFVFVATSGVLPPDQYTLTLRSGADAFQDAAGGALDGNADDVAGDDFTATFAVAAPPANAIMVSLPHFARGPEQAVNVPASPALGLPIQVSDGGGLTAMNFELAFDSGLLNVTAVSLVGGGTATLIPVSAERVQVALTFAAALDAGPQTVAYLTAAVPTSAASRYGERGVLDIGALSLTAGGSVPGIDQDAVHVNSYFGDTGRNGRYDSFDVQQASRIAVRLDTGFQQHPLLDPLILCDFNGNQRIDSFDVQRLSRLALRLSVDEAPPLPSPTPIVTDTDRLTAKSHALEKLPDQLPGGLRSDVDRNGAVDAQDVLWAIYSFNESPKNDPQAKSDENLKLDANGDSQFDPADILLVITDAHAAQNELADLLATDAVSARKKK